jgi:hypothetical protein
VSTTRFAPPAADDDRGSAAATSTASPGSVGSLAPTAINYGSGVISLTPVPAGLTQDPLTGERRPVSVTNNFNVMGSIATMRDIAMELRDINAASASRGFATAG